MDTRNELSSRALEAALRASEERFSNAFDFSAIGMALVSPTGQWLRVNESLCAILGYSVGELLATTFLTITYPDDLELDLSNVASLLAGNIRTYTMEKRYIHKSGAIIWAQLNVSLVRDPKGAPLHFVSQIEDITDRKRAENQIREAEAKFRAVFNYNPIMCLLTVHPDQRIVEVNDACLQGLRFSRDRMVGRRTEELGIWPSPEEQARYQHVIRSAQAADAFETALKRSDGSTFQAKINSSSFVLEGQRYRMHLVEDITERQRTQAELMLAKDAAESASRAKSDFLATMSHEIRTPLNGVFGFTDMLLHTPLNEEQTEFVRVIKNSGDALLDIINDILDFSKIEAGKLELESAPYNLRTVCQDVAALLRPKALEKGLRLTLEYPADLRSELIGDAARVRQILLNLTGNALKFTDQGSVHIDVRLTRADDMKISVTDSGDGIAPEIQNKLFERFTQADSSTTRRYGGTGLGLAICKRLTELMGVKLGVTSEIGVGSTFWFTQSATAPAPGAAPMARLSQWEKTPSEPQPPTATARALLVDDNEVNRLLGRRLLERLGCKVETANDGQEAVASADRSTFDLIFMDCHMPRMDGFEATRVLRRAQSGGRRSPIIALTASVTIRDQDECKRAGMDDFLGKPLEVKKLAEVIEKWRDRGFDSSPQREERSAVLQSD